MTAPLDLLIIGAGQAGLALGYQLKLTPYRFQLVDGHARLGDSWRTRYDSLTLFTPRCYSALPGLALAGDPEGYAGRDEFADYLETYAGRFALPVVTGTRIHALDRANGRFRAVTSGGVIEARAVVLATGAFQTPVVPPLANGLSNRMLQFTPASYRSPSQVPSGATVVVVGDGATGRDIADELNTGRAVYLAAGRSRPAMPERLLGRSLFWWLDKTGALTASPETAVGRYLKQSDGFPARGRELGRLRQRGVRVRSRVIRGEGEQITFADGETVTADAVVWATGYRDDSAWVNLAAAQDRQGNFVHAQGVSPVPGLFFIGRPWQRSRASALITGVGADAIHLLGLIRQYLAQG